MSGEELNIFLIIITAIGVFGCIGMFLISCQLDGISHDLEAILKKNGRKDEDLYFNKDTDSMIFQILKDKCTSIPEEETEASVHKCEKCPTIPPKKCDFCTDPCGNEWCFTRGI